MPSPPIPHPVIRTVAWLSIVGGLITMGWSLLLLHTALQQQDWPATPIVKAADSSLHYRVGERDFRLDTGQPEFATLAQEPATATVVFYDPAAPEQVVLRHPNFWWPLYLSMAGLIVFYAGLHLQREKDRNVQSLGFE